MFVYCDKCGYFSGDQEGCERLVEEVIKDGGRVEAVRDSRGRLRSWKFTCPSGHGDEHMQGTVGHE